MFLTTIRRFPKIFQNCSEGLTNISEHFPKIAEGSRRFPRKYRWCFDHTTPPTEYLYEYFLSDHVAIAMAILRLVTTTLYFYTSKYCIFTYENIWIFSVAEILIKHWSLYNKIKYSQLKGSGEHSLIRQLCIVNNGVAQFICRIPIGHLIFISMVKKYYIHFTVCNFIAQSLYSHNIMPFLIVCDQ